MANLEYTANDTREGYQILFELLRLHDITKETDEEGLIISEYTPLCKVEGIDSIIMDLMTRSQANAIVQLFARDKMREELITWYYNTYPRTSYPVIVKAEFVHNLYINHRDNLTIEYLE